MTDLSATIAPNSSQLNSDDLISGPRTIKIAKVAAWNSEQPIAISFDGDNGKPYLPCKSMRRVLVHVWGTDGNTYVGRSMTLYRDPEVLFGGVKVGGIRISHMTNMEADVILSLTASKKSRAPYRVRVLQAAKPAPSPASVAADAFTQDQARAAARRGTEAFKAWWATNPDWRADATLIKGELQQFCADADKAASEADNPFGLPPITPTQAEIDAAMAEAALATKEAEE